MSTSSNFTRREAITRLMALTGTLAVGAELFLSGCSHRDAVNRTTPFTSADIALLDEIGETIIPATDIPGAKAVGIGAFMAQMATDCYDDATYGSFRSGLATISTLSEKRFGQSFVSSSAANRTTLLNDLEREQRDQSKTRKTGQAVHYFRLMKELTLLGYFSSEIGCTKALRYVETPGSYNGNLPYQKGDKAFYNPSRRIS